MRTPKTVFVVVMVVSCALTVMAQSKPKLTLDEFFNSVSFSGVEISPDGNSVVIVTERADWDQQIFRKDLWLYHDDGKGGVASDSVDAVGPRFGAEVVARRPLDRLPLRAQSSPARRATTPILIRTRKTKPPARSTSSRPTAAKRSR